MNTAQSNIQHHFLLHETAMEVLRLISKCKEKGDDWAVEQFSGMYAGILRELAGEQIEKTIEQYLTDDQIEGMYNSDMQVDSNGILSFTPENE